MAPAMNTFDEATKVKQVDDHTYQADFAPDWVIGTVPHGGYVTSCFLSVVRKHFDTTLRKQDQPHTIASHLDFLRTTQVGLATFTVKAVKLGRQTSIIHATLIQDDREEVVGYFTNSNINSESGVTFSTEWQLHPKPVPLLTNFPDLEANYDPNWGERKEWPFVDFRKAATKIRSWFPRRGQHSQACIDTWFCFKDPQSRFTNESLGYICDTFPQIIESYMLDGLDPYALEFEKNNTQEEQKAIMKGRAAMWYPTVCLNMDIKNALPEAGGQWLFTRLQAKKILNGRYDLEVLVLDEDGELVAITNHVCFAVSASRNVAARRKGENGNGEPKL